MLGLEELSKATKANIPCFQELSISPQSFSAGLSGTKKIKFFLLISIS